MKGLVEILKQSNNREEATSYIQTNKMKVSDLKAVAKELDMWVNNKWNKAQLVENLVEGTIGARLRIRALMTK